MGTIGRQSNVTDTTDKGTNEATAADTSAASAASEPSRAYEDKIAALSDKLAKLEAAAADRDKAAKRSNRAANKEAGDLAAAYDEAQATIAGLEAKIGELETLREKATAWERYQKQQAAEVDKRFKALPDETRARCPGGDDAATDVKRAFLAAFDVSGSAGTGADTSGGQRPAPRTTAPASAPSAVDPFTMSPGERREFLADAERREAWLKTLGVRDRSRDVDIFGRPLKR